MVMVLIGGGYMYYQALPKPVMIKAEIQPLQITPNYDNAKPDDLNIHFKYDFSTLNKDQDRPRGQPSVARIDLVGEEITSGIQLTPAKKGKWVWGDDRNIHFEPESDWPAGTHYTLTIEQSILSQDSILSATSYMFTSPEFIATFTNTELYQDPQDISVRRVISTLQFTHPVDKASLEKMLSMTMRPSGLTIDTTPKAYAFDVSYDKNQREAYIQSIPVVLPSKPNYMKIAVAAGVKSLLGGASLNKATEEKILIPDLYSFLKVSSANTTIVRNVKNEPEQMLMLEFTDDINAQELLSKLTIYILPKKGEKKGRKYWKGPREVNEAILVMSDKVDFRVIANEREASKHYSFALDLPENRYIYVKIAPGLTSANKFVHESFYDTVLTTPVYPKEVNIAGEGSVLTYSGDHKLSVLSRGLPALKYSVGRLLEGQLYHLISQTRGDITQPSFQNWNFDSNNISEFYEEVVSIHSDHPQKANYSSLDLTRYLPQDDNRFGLFFIDIKGWNPARNTEFYGVNDQRLILVTDLGVIVKNNANQTHDVFVQSIQTGLPVEGATVELLGKNGIALYSKKTSANGHVNFSSTADFTHEKQPTVYVVKAQNDLSFIPFDRRSRQINMSKFDIGGVSSNVNQRDALNAYVFSDRGIYRPGETVNTGFIVKNVDFSNVEGIPLEVVVHGPRNNEVKIKKIKLPEKGFFDFQYLTDATSDTGRYQVSLHLIRDNRYRGRKIGSTSFKVEEFQPDTMKIESRILNVEDKGWYQKGKININVSLNNLFGIPAQNRNLTGRMIIRPARFSFKEYSDFTFTTPFTDKHKTPLSIDERLATQKTDADGRVHFEVDLQRFSQGTYDFQFIAEGFDQAGGRSVTSSNRALISPLEFLVGHKADGALDYINANSKRTIEFISIDKALNKRKQAGLRFNVIEVQYVSTLVKQGNGTYKYQTVKKEKEQSSSALEITEKGYQYAIDTTIPGDFAIEILDANNRRLSRVNYSVVGVGNLAGKLDKNAELQLKLDKADYHAGELIEMNIKAPYAGAGLITIESDKVHHFKWFNTDTESTIQTIRIPDELEGTGYVNVAFVRDVGSKEIFSSPLSYAVKPFSIDKDKRKIDVTLDISDIIRPGKPMKIGYTASKKSRIAIFAVDEGILQVAKYKTPDPLGHFLKKRSLEVETLQILDLILPGFDLMKSLSASGGGARESKALAKNMNPFSRKTDKPAVYWSGIHDAGPENKHVIFNVPNTFAGSLRVIAVSVGDDSMGVASDSSIVRGPFVISPNVLTQTAPGDEFLVTVGVANIIDGSGKKAPIDIKVQASKHLEIIGENHTTLAINEGGEGQFQFKVKANDILGAAELTFTARYKNESMTRTTSLSVRPAMPYYTGFESGYKSTGEVDMALSRPLYASLAKQAVSASASPLVLVDGLTAYLDTFPHGCTEQVVSKVFPLVGLMTHPAFGANTSKVRSHFSHVIDKLRERQLGDGGFAFWPGHRSTAEYPSIYVMHFLIESRDLGYPVPGDMIQKGRDYLNDYASRSSASIMEARNRATAIYLLTRLGEVTTNYLVDLQEYLENHHNKEWKQDFLASYMAATYQLLQKGVEANRLISGYQLSKNDYKWVDDFHSPLTQDAQHIYLLSKHFETRAKALAGEDLLALTEKIFKGEYNTHSSAYSILALGAYSKLALGDQFDEQVTFTAISKNDQKKVLDAAFSPFLSASYPVDTKAISLESNKPLYYLNVRSGFDKELPKKAVREGIEIVRQFTDSEGNILTSFEQGKEVTVQLKVRALGDRYLTNIAVIDLLPGGFEVIRSSVSRTAHGWRADYIDIREDRVVYYGNFDRSVKVLTYKVKLTAAGDFVVPPSYAESMYDRSIRSVSKAGRFTVTPSK